MEISCSSDAKSSQDDDHDAPVMADFGQTDLGQFF